VRSTPNGGYGIDDAANIDQFVPKRFPPDTVMLDPSLVAVHRPHLAKRSAILPPAMRTM
jgi:hypothetical protein